MIGNGVRRYTACWFATGIVLLIAIFILLLLIGSVSIPSADVFSIIFGGDSSKSYWKVIVLDTRLPMAIASLSCGMALSVSGLLMQTLFRNPLAGPSILGVSSGASLGVAVVMLGGAVSVFTGYNWIVQIIGALLGAGVTILVLIMFSSIMRNGVMLLIVGILISYLSNALISLLNYFSPAEEIRSYLFWGLGSFAGLDLTQSVWLLLMSLLAIIFSFYYIKPLNALLLGERYTESLGYSLPVLRCGLLIITGILVAVPTAFCGPIAFIGLIVPHLCRLILKSSTHHVLLPACIIFGGVVSMGCALLGVLPSEKFGILPINVVTPLIGIPTVIYLLINRKRIAYFQ